MGKIFGSPNPVLKWREIAPVLFKTPENLRDSVSMTFILEVINGKMSGPFPVPG